VLIIPDHGTTGTKSHKFSLTKITALFAGYTLLISILGYIFFSITSLGDILLSNKKFSQEEINKIDELNNRMIFLSKELESLKSTNERLRYAIMLGDSTMLESLYIKNDTSSLKKKSDGNILSVFRDFVRLYLQKPQETIYFTKPVNGFISREFNSDKGHIGIDFVVKKGTSIYSAANGYVVFSDYTIQDGLMMIINHEDSYISVYKHCSVLLKKPREKVHQGEIIALSGNSGETTTGPHLHFEIWKDGQPVNPKSLFYNQ
jgi:murein DD-endopeptidase MepM/ murein hydrolase activator NlpD